MKLTLSVRFFSRSGAGRRQRNLGLGPAEAWAIGGRPSGPPGQPRRGERRQLIGTSCSPVDFSVPKISPLPEVDRIFCGQSPVAPPSRPGAMLAHMKRSGSEPPIRVTCRSGHAGWPETAVGPCGPVSFGRPELEPSVPEPPSTRSTSSGERRQLIDHFVFTET